MKKLILLIFLTSCAVARHPSETSGDPAWCDRFIEEVAEAKYMDPPLDEITMANLLAAKRDACNE